MPTYRIETNRGTFLDIEANRPPEEDEISALEAEGHFKPITPAPDLPPSGVPVDQMKQQFQQATPMQRMGMLAKNFLPYAGNRYASAVDPATQAAVRGGATATGMALGAMVPPPFDLATIPIGGALGAISGALAANKFTGRKTTGGDIASSAILGGIPLGGSAGNNALRLVAGGLTAKTAETSLNEGRMPTLGEAAVAAGSGAAAGFLSSAIENGKNAAAFDARRSVNSLRRETMKIGDELGYVLPPSLRTKVDADSSMLANSLESIGGKAATAQQVTHMNQPITNRLVKEEIGVNPLKPLSDDVIEQAAKPYTDVYAKVGSISPQSAQALKEFKQANADSNSLFAQYRNNPVKDPGLLEQAKKFAADADFYMQFLESEAKAAGKARLIPEFREARVKLAQIGLVRESVNRATGDIDASVIGRVYDARQPLTGNLEKIGRFQNAFSKALADAATTPVPGVNQLARYAMPLAAGGAAATGGAGLPMAVAAGVGTAAAPSAARSFMLSKPGQQFFKPNYGTANPSFLANFGRSAAQNAHQFKTP
jgi:hypothetical protein